MANILAQRAMLMTLSLTAWSARKLDRKVTDETNRMHNADRDAGRYNKQLLAKDALAEIASLDAEIRAYYYSHTSPWLDREGTRILSSVHAVEALQWFQGKRFEREDAVNRFVSGYPQFVSDAEKRLNGMFDANDYPAPSAIANRFRYVVSVDNVPDSNDFRVEMADGQAEDIKREIEARSNAALDTVIRDCYERIAKHVGLMSARLKSFKPATDTSKQEGKLYDSMVENVRELTALLPALNVSGDPALAQIAARMTALCHEDVDALKEHVQAREAVVRDADAILADVQAFLA